MKSAVVRVSVALALLCAFASSAKAHIQLEYPPHRYSDQKNGPCGAEEDYRTDEVTVFEPGETITVEWEETITHPSHFRIAFSLDGTDDFEDPADFDDFYTNEAVLADDIPDREEGGHYEYEVELPSQACERCTLQVIQVMYDREPYGPGSLYWQCADVQLHPGGPIVAPEPESGSCHVAGRAGAGGALVALMVLASLRGFAQRRRE